MSQPITFPPGHEFKLKDLSPVYDSDEYNKKSGRKRTVENAEALSQLGYQLYAENKRSVLLVLQGMDSAGKDSTIRAIMGGLNPQSCSVSSFKKPTEEELDHDFLWRVHKVVPRRGNIGIFNRSHYEDVLVVRVHNLVPQAQWEQRYNQINEFEQLLSENGTKIVKCFLHISKEEQRARLQERVDDPNRRWKFNKGDLDERKLWDKYQEAYEAALTRCNTEWAPWHVIQADRNWCRKMIVSEILRQTIEEMDPQFPNPDDGIEGIVVV